MQDPTTGRRRPIADALARKVQELQQDPTAPLDPRCAVYVGEYLRVNGGTFKVVKIDKRFVRLRGVSQQEFDAAMGRVL